MQEAARPPRRARGQASLARLVEGARGLLVEEGLEALTVARVVERAGSSVGVFYARFRDKQGLLEHLAQVYAEEAAGALGEFAGGGRALGSVEQEVRSVVALVVRFHRERAGWVRALLLEARGRPVGGVARRMRGMRDVPPALVRRVAEAAGRPVGGNVSRGFRAVLALVREEVVFGEGRGEGNGEGDEELVELASAAWLGVLGSVRAGGGAADLYS